MGNVDPKMGCKIWTPFRGPPNCFFFSRAPKRGPDFRHHFGVHIARFFFAAWRPKRSSPSRMWAGSFTSQAHGRNCTHTSLVGSDVLVHLPYPCQFSSHIAPRNPELLPLAPFSYRTPSEVLELISSLTKTHMATQAGMHTRIASGSIDADLYYALYCTPYYGFSPDTSPWRMSLIAPQRIFSPCWPQPTSNGPPFTLAGCLYWPSHRRHRHPPPFSYGLALLGWWVLSCSACVWETLWCFFCR